MQSPRLPLGISIKSTIGIGDALQFSSLPENYFRATGKKLVDVSQPWFFDHNPFVQRNVKFAVKTMEMWNFSPTQYEWPKPRPEVYLSNAEIFASVFRVPVVLNRPRLYRYEEWAFEKRELILLHVSGRSHGLMPEHIIRHVVQKYGPTRRLFQIGKPEDPNLGLEKIPTPTLWDLALLIARSRMVISMDSGPSWIATCYPDVITKIVRSKPSADVLKTWVPLQINNIHSHWDDRCRSVHNTTEEDIGFTYSYRRI